MIGTIVGIAGFAVGLISLWRSQVSGIIAVQSHDVPMIGGGEAVFPDEVEVRYRGTSVPRLTSGNVWIWALISDLTVVRLPIRSAVTP